MAGLKTAVHRTADDFRVIDLKDFLKADTPPREYLVDKIIPKKGLVYVYGPPASFKTNFLLYMTLNCAKGNNVFGYEVKKPLKVFWIDEENREIGMHDKLKKITKGMGFDENSIEYGKYGLSYSGNFIILEPECLSKLEGFIKKYEFNIVVIDSIAKVFPLNERDESDVKKIFAKLTPLMSKYDVSFILIHHTRKLSQGQKSRNMEDISGSREFSAMADSMLYLQSVGNNKFMLKQTKNRYDKNVEAINFSVAGDDESLTIKYEGLARDNIKKTAELVKSKILDLLISNPQPEYKTTTLIKAMKEQGWKETSIRAGLKLLVDDGILSNKIYGKHKFLEAGK